MKPSIWRCSADRQRQSYFENNEDNTLIVLSPDADTMYLSSKSTTLTAARCPTKTRRNVMSLGDCKSQTAIERSWNDSHSLSIISIKNHTGYPKKKRGALGLRVWPILSLGFRDLRLNHTGFQVLRCVMGCGFHHFWCSGFEYFIKTSNFSGFRSHAVHVVNWDWKTIFQILKTRRRESVETKMLEKDRKLLTKIEDFHSERKFRVLAILLERPLFEISQSVAQVWRSWDTQMSFVVFGIKQPGRAIYLFFASFLKFRTTNHLFTNLYFYYIFIFLFEYLYLRSRHLYQQTRYLCSSEISKLPSRGKHVIRSKLQIYIVSRSSDAFSEAACSEVPILMYSSVSLSLSWSLVIATTSWQIHSALISRAPESWIKLNEKQLEIALC